MNKLFVRAAMLKDSTAKKIADAITKKEKGINEVVIILIIIAVAAGLIGAFYLWSKSQLLPTIETQIDNSIKTWFSPN